MKKKIVIWVDEDGEINMQSTMEEDPEQKAKYWFSQFQDEAKRNIELRQEIRELREKQNVVHVDGPVDISYSYSVLDEDELLAEMTKLNEKLETIQGAGYWYKEQYYKCTEEVAKWKDKFDAEFNTCDGLAKELAWIKSELVIAERDIKEYKRLHELVAEIRKMVNLEWLDEFENS